MQADKGILIHEGGRVSGTRRWSWATQADARQFGRLEPVEATDHHQRVAFAHGIWHFFSGHVRMYPELSGRLHKMLRVGKFDERKGSKKKLAWTTGADEAFETLKRTLLGKLGSILFFF